MTLFIRHKALVGALAALVVLLASSGFTVVLHSCLMGSMASCALAPSSDHMAMASVPADHGSMGARFEGSPCCSTRVVGGVKTAPAVSQKVQDVEHQTYIIVSADRLCALSSSEPSTQPIQTLSGVEAVPLSSVEKCVLNATFLI